MKASSLLAISFASFMPAAAWAQAAPTSPPTAAAQVTNVDGVKDYLLKTATKMKAASTDFEKNAAAYAKIIQDNNGDYKQAYAKNKAELTKLIETLRENYKAMDSFGYETIEGIVAGVPSLEDYDIYLDAGVPKAEASGDSKAAPVTLKLANGQVIDQEGCLFTYIIEPALWGGNPKWCVAVDLNGDGKTDARESLPKAEVLTAAAVDVNKKIGELLASSQAWKPTSEDCFAAMIAMTPTLSGYFDDWKESRYSDDKSGRFQAVSRVSDMRGIMSSVSILYSAVKPQVDAKDPALSKSIQLGFADILVFIDRVDAREKSAGGKLTVAEIDELGNQAKQKADKLVPQVEQAAAILNIKPA